MNVSSNKSPNVGFGYTIDCEFGFAE